MVEFPMKAGVVYETPGYLEFFTDAVTALYDSWMKDESDWVRIQVEHTHFKLSYLVLAIMCGLMWTVVRRLASQHLFTPLYRRCGVNDEKVLVKLRELSFNFMWSLLAWIHCAYLTLYKYQLFQNPTKIIYEWDNSREADMDQCLIFLYQAGFYIHRTWASLMEDEWRRDSPVLIAHHLFTFALLTTGFLYRYYYCGIFVLFLHDMNDMLLSLSKIANYLTNQNGDNFWAYFSRILFIAFVYLWYLFRLNYFPLLLLHTTINLARTIYVDRFPPMFFFNNFLLMLLLLMHFYWFKFILAAAFKIVCNAKGPIKDDRDIEVSEEEEKKQK